MRLASFPWGTLTLGLIAGHAAVSVLSRLVDPDGHGVLARFSNQAIGVLVILVLATGITGLLLRTGDRPAIERHGGSLRFRIRGRAREGVGWGVFVGALFPVAVLLIPVTRDEPDDRLHFGLSMLVTCAVAAIAARLLRPTHLWSGRRGLVVSRPFGGVAIPWARVDAIDVDTRAGRVVVRTSDGGTTAIGCPGLDPVAMGELERELRAHVPDDRPVPWHAEARWAVLDRAGRPVEVWRTALRSLVLGDEGYRAAPVERADVVRLLCDPAASAERRIAAALALQAGGDPDLAEHGRAALDATADRALRAALRGILRGRPSERRIARAIERDFGAP